MIIIIIKTDNTNIIMFGSIKKNKRNIGHTTIKVKVCYDYVVTQIKTSMIT